VLGSQGMLDGYSKRKKQQLAGALREIVMAARNTIHLVEYNEWTSGAVDRFALRQERARIFEGQHLQDQYSPLLVELGSLRDVLDWCRVLNIVTRIRTSINSEEDAGQAKLEEIERCVARAESWARTIEENLRRCHDVFLSYCATDRHQAEQLFSRLTQNGIEVYFSERMVPSGAIFDEAIRGELLRSEEVWLLVTEASLRSEWVTTEWGAAWALKKIVVRVLLGCRENVLPLRLRVRQHVLFENYDQASTLFGPG
jgi:hypothetical protein